MLQTLVIHDKYFNSNNAHIKNQLLQIKKLFNFNKTSIVLEVDLCDVDHFAFHSSNFHTVISCSFYKYNECYLNHNSTRGSSLHSVCTERGRQHREGGLLKKFL